MRKKHLFFTLVLSGLSPVSQAQTPDSLHNAAETSQRSAYAPGEVITPDGQKVKAYFPHSINGIEKTISYFTSHRK